MNMVYPVRIGIFEKGNKRRQTHRGKPSIKTIEDRYDIFFLKVYIVASKSPTLFQRQLDQERQPLYINKRKKGLSKTENPCICPKSGKQNTNRIRLFWIEDPRA